MPAVAPLDFAARQVRSILAPLGRALTPPTRALADLVVTEPATGRGDPTAQARSGDGFLNLPDGVIKVFDLVPLACPGRFVAGKLQMPAQQDQCLLFLGRGLRRGQRFIVAMPALADLRLPQPTVPLSTGGAFVLTSRATRQVDDLGQSGFQVGTPQSQRTHTDAVLSGDLLEHVDRARQRHTGRP